MRRLLFVFAALAASFSLTSCGGGGATSYHVNRTTTVGQELSDLYAARSKGAISEDEYNEQKAKILSGEIYTDE